MNRTIALVLNWNSWSDTIACVESLLRSHQVPDRIVVCDNGSVDESIERLAGWAAQRPGYRFFSSAAEALESADDGERLSLIAIGNNGGYASGNNVGLQYALRRGAEFAWILNSDVLVAPDALERILELAGGDANIGIVGAKLLRFDRPDTIQALGGGRIIPIICHDTQAGSGRKSEMAAGVPLRVDHLVGASLFVRTAAVRDVGFIDESYFLYREETDWCIRMRRRGWKLYCCTRAQVWHRQSQSIGFKSPIHDYYAVRNMLRLVHKFYRTSFPIAFGYFMARSIAPKLLRMEFDRLSAVWAALADFARGAYGRAAEHGDDVLMRNYMRASTKRSAAGVTATKGVTDLGAAVR